MAKNFKIADIKPESVYNVSLIDNWYGTAESKEMTGAELISFTQAAAHLYDIHATEKEIKTMNIYEAMTAELEKRNDRSAWNKGVTVYAMELLDTLKERTEYEHRQPQSMEELKAWLLNGANSWSQYSYGGCALIYDTDICYRLSNPTEIKRTHGGEKDPNRSETWLDVQTRALNQAARRLMQLFKF